MIRETTAVESKCNCFVRQSNGVWMPGIRVGNDFYSPEGQALANVAAYRDATSEQIDAEMRQRGEVMLTCAPAMVQ